MPKRKLETTKSPKAVSASKKAKPQSYHHGNLREEVLEHSLRVLEEKGAYALSLRDIAAALCVSHTAPYKHFPKKIDLLCALAAKGFEDLALCMQKAWDYSSDPVQRLEKSGEEYIYLLLKYPRRTELMFGGELKSNLESIVEEEKQNLAKFGEMAYVGMYSIVEAGQKANRLRTDVPTGTLMMSYWSCVHGFAVLNEQKWKTTKSHEEKESFQKEIEQILKIMIDGTKI